jgi:major intrinsic protein
MLEKVLVILSDAHKTPAPQSADRTRESIAVTPSAMSVQTQKKTPLELAILPPTSPAPLLWTTGTPDPRIDARRMMTYPDRRPPSTSVPYIQTTRMSTPAKVEVHLISIPVTNTSVNPARSTGPALFVGGWAVQQLWLFWVAPLLGAAAAGFMYKALLEGPAEAPPVTGRPVAT